MGGLDLGGRSRGLHSGLQGGPAVVRAERVRLHRAEQHAERVRVEREAVPRVGGDANVRLGASEAAQAGAEAAVGEGGALEPQGESCHPAVLREVEECGEGGREREAE